MAKTFGFKQAKQNTPKQPPELTAKQLKRHRTKVAVRIVAPVLALTFAIIGVSFSWLNFNRTATVNEFSMTTVKVNNTLISTDGVEWTDGIIFDKDDKVSFRPVAGDGNTFYLQRQVDENGDRIGTWETLPDGKETLVPSYDYQAIDDLTTSDAISCVDFQLKSDSDSRLFLDPASSIAPADEADWTDYAVGAIRMAMYAIDADGNAELLFMWIPNTTYQVVLSADEQSHTSVVTDSTVIETIKLTTASDGSYTEIDTGGESSGYTMINDDSAYLFWGDLSKIDIVATEPMIQTTRGEAQHFRIVFWFEATDRECETFFMGGDMTAELLFKSEID